jgi:hypothetical protein
MLTTRAGSAADRGRRYPGVWFRVTLFRQRGIPDESAGNRDWHSRHAVAASGYGAPCHKRGCTTLEHESGSGPGPLGAYDAREQQLLSSHYGAHRSRSCERQGERCLVHRNRNRRPVWDTRSCARSAGDASTRVRSPGPECSRATRSDLVQDTSRTGAPTLGPCRIPPSGKRAGNGDATSGYPCAHRGFVAGGQILRAWGVCSVKSAARPALP